MEPMATEVNDCVSTRSLDGFSSDFVTVVDAEPEKIAEQLRIMEEMVAIQQLTILELTCENRRLKALIQKFSGSDIGNQDPLVQKKASSKRKRCTEEAQDGCEPRRLKKRIDEPCLRDSDAFLSDSSGSV